MKGCLFGACRGLFFAVAASLLVVPASLEAGMTLQLAREGATEYRVAQAVDASIPEVFAARELTNFLRRVTGARFPVVSEPSLPPNFPCIYVGRTAYAAAQGIELDRLGEEEWVIRSVGDNIVLVGGRPRGTLYAVYEFLEDHVGCHWLDRRTEIVPSRPTLELEPLDARGKPWFWRRAVHSPTGTPDDKWLFMIRNKNFRYDFRGRRDNDFFPKGAFSRVSSAHTGIHSFSDFVNAGDWFETHPEYFALEADGKRIPAYDGSGPGQLCLTHHDVLSLTVAKLREFIVADRKEAAARGVPPPKLYQVAQNDKYHAHCQCPNCQAIATREESESGPLVAFVNAVAEEIETDYPNLLVGTIAYNLTQPPPKTLRPRVNVLIGWCDVYSRVDLVRPLSHPWNRHHYDQIARWGEISRHVGIGDDYWTSLSYYAPFPTPYCIIQSITADLKHFAQVGAETFFCEAAEYTEAGQQFVRLRRWLAYQLLVDPLQPPEPLIRVFMDGYYGAAAEPMIAYLRYLRRRIDADAQFKMTRDAPHKLAYLDLDFFATAQQRFDEAEARVSAGGREWGAIREERFILDGALLFLWPWLERYLPPGKAMPFDKDKVIDRYSDEWRVFTKRRHSAFYTQNPNSLNADGKLRERMVSLFRDARLPKRFAELPSRDVADFNWTTFSQIHPRQKFVADEDAAGGMTATFTTRGSIQAAEEGGVATVASAGETFRQPLTFGATGGAKLTVAPDEIPRDGAYHLYEIGRIRVEPGTMVWALEGKKRLGVVVDRLHKANAKDPRANEWNAFVSLKVRGPAYVPGATETNGAWMDRVILVKPREDEAASDEDLRFKAR